ncbi:YjgF-like protein [Pyronema omphalodes]|nr:YjgF-like protein [Pyronema omphalodes]
MNITIRRIPSEGYHKKHPNSQIFTMSTSAFKTGNPYEALFGYSRAVRRGNLIYVSGTTSLSPVAPFDIQFPGDAYHQTITALEESIRAIEGLGGWMQNIARIKLFVGRQEDCDSVGRAMAKVMNGQSFAATMIVGASFVRHEMLVEVEMDAIL